VTLKLSRKPLYEQAYEAILQMILNGQVQPGERVTETSLARLLGISPTPVREAMRKLEHDGLLQSSGTSVHVIQLSVEDIEQLYLCREVLEVLAIERVVEHLSNADLQALDVLLTAAEVAGDEADVLELVHINTAFHDRLLEATKNPWLVSAIRFVRRPLLLARIQITFDPGEAHRILRDHRAIVRALKQGDAEAATEMMRAHMRADCKYIRQAFRTAPPRSQDEQVGLRQRSSR